MSGPGGRGSTDAGAVRDRTDNSAEATFRVLEQADPSVVQVDVSEPFMPWTGRDVRVQVANVGQGPMVKPAELTVTVCPEKPSPTQGPCEVPDVPSEIVLSSGANHTVQAHWDATGDAGEFEVCASLDYDLRQEAAANDRGCQDTYALAAAGPVGGVRGPG